MHEVGEWERISPHHSKLIMKRCETDILKIEINVVYRYGKWRWYMVCNGWYMNEESNRFRYDSEQDAQQYAAASTAYWLTTKGVEYYA